MHTVPCCVPLLRLVVTAELTISILDLQRGRSGQVPEIEIGSPE